MRDDVKIIAAHLLSLYNEKLSLTQHLHRNETDISHYLKTGKTDRVMNLLGEDDFIIEKIDSLDQLIAADFDSLINITGISYNDIHIHLRSLGNSDFDNIYSVIDQIQSLMEEILQLRDKSEIKLEEAAAQTGKDLKSFLLTEKLYHKLEE